MAVDYEECRLLESDTVWLLQDLTFRRNVSPSIFSLMLEEIYSSETLVLTRAIRCNIQEDAILHSHRRENLKSYKED
jgi:hypothetical protein